VQVLSSLVTPRLRFRSYALRLLRFALRWTSCSRMRISEDEIAIKEGFKVLKTLPRLICATKKLSPKQSRLVLCSTRLLNLLKRNACSDCQQFSGCMSHQPTMQNHHQGRQRHQSWNALPARAAPANYSWDSGSKPATLVIKPIAAGTVAGTRCGINQIVAGKIAARAKPINGRLNI